MKKTEIIKRAFVRSLPVMAGYVVLGMGFGILMSRNGYGFLWSVGSSLFIFAGSMQFVAADLLTAAASPLYAAVMTLTVNARHIFYGVSMIGKYRDMGAARPYLIFGLTDETYSLLCGGEDWPEGGERLYCLLVTAFDHAYWVAGTAAGALVGTALPFNSAGIEFSMTALFVTVFAEQWLGSERHGPALAGLAASCVCLAVFGSGSFMIPTMLLITVLLSLPAGKERRHE